MSMTNMLSVIRLIFQVLFIGGCLILWSSGAQANQQKLKVITSFSITADLVEQIAQDKIELTNLVGPNSDGHMYQPSAQDSVALAKADLVFINGLGFEGWIERLIKASGFRGESVILTQDIKPIYAGSAPDPHAWQSISNVESYVAIITKSLAMQDPPHKLFYEKNATLYLQQLAQMKQDFIAFCSSLQPEQRRLVTSHDAFTYFGRECNIQFLAPQGISTEDEPSAQDVAMLIEQIKSQKIPALFIENMTNPKLIEQIQRETGVVLGGKLYSDALSEKGGPAATYIQMMQYNLNILKDALNQAQRQEVKK